MKRIVILLLGLLIISLTPIMITDIVVYNEEIEVYDNEPTLIEIELPQGKDTKNKTYMDYKLITDKSSPQYKFIQENCKVSDNGFLMVDNEWYCVALGNYFSDSIGTKYIITLENGNQIKVVKTEIKDNLHTCDLNYQHKIDGSVIEFLLDTTKLQDKKTQNGYLWNGNLNNVVEFKGGIIKIERVIE